MKVKNLYIEEELESLNGNLFLKKFLIPDNISPGNVKVYMYELKNNEIVKMVSKNLQIKKPIGLSPAVDHATAATRCLIDDLQYQLNLERG